MGPQALSTFVIRWGISEGESGFLAFCLAKSCFTDRLRLEH